MIMAKQNTQKETPFAAALEYFLWLKKTTQQELAVAVGYKNRNMIAAMLAG